MEQFQFVKVKLSSSGMLMGLVRLYNDNRTPLSILPMGLIAQPT